MEEMQKQINDLKAQVETLTSLLGRTIDACDKHAKATKQLADLVGSALGLKQ